MSFVGDWWTRLHHPLCKGGMVFFLPCLMLFLPCSFLFPVRCFLFPAWCFSVPGVFSPWLGVLFPVGFCFFPVSSCLFPGVTGAQKSKWKQIIQAANGSKRICRGSRHAFAFCVCFQRCHFFSSAWHGLLSRMLADGEVQVVEWLRSYKRPLPSVLQQKYSATTPQLTYVRMWNGAEGCVPGSGSGS